MVGSRAIEGSVAGSLITRHRSAAAATQLCCCSSSTYYSAVHCSSSTGAHRTLYLTLQIFNSARLLRSSSTWAHIITLLNSAPTLLCRSVSCFSNSTMFSNFLLSNSTLFSNSTLSILEQSRLFCRGSSPLCVESAAGQSDLRYAPGWTHSSIFVFVHILYLPGWTHSST